MVDDQWMDGETVKKKKKRIPVTIYILRCLSHACLENN